MDTLGLKSSKFDVSWEGSLNLTYKHPIHGPTKVSEQLPIQIEIYKFKKELSLCHKLEFSNRYNFATQCRRP